MTVDSIDAWRTLAEESSLCLLCYTAAPRPSAAALVQMSSQVKSKAVHEQPDTRLYAS